ncbi:hypothetical protein ACWENQ_02885 [Nonomuraea sp. NPDC004354]
MITELRVSARTAELLRPWGPDVPYNHVVVVRITLDEPPSPRWGCWPSRTR